MGLGYSQEEREVADGAVTGSSRGPGSERVQTMGLVLSSVGHLGTFAGAVQVLGDSSL